MLKRGTQIIYVPVHTNGSTWHIDCERGFVTSVSDRGAFCRYWNKSSPNELRTKSNSELTPLDRLVAKDTVPQDMVEGQLAEIAEAAAKDWHRRGRLTVGRL